ncbi:anti-virulence regulator CigR family protein [Dryocola clanedunensis]|uniref:anti-virulence regulator CigR family protein n=1 Tax=Cedecea sulfonylureivorans TaxID=3051154 RepID=UPI0019278F91|nr:anti-virulence regulator CigR family protein [Cedecea sulfonylureivorans]
MFKRRGLLSAVTVVVSLALFTAPVFANPGNGNGNGGSSKGANHGNGKGNAHSNKGEQGKGNSSADHGSRKNYGKPDHVDSDISFKDARSLAVNYGLTGYKSLPPGIAKNLARGKPLPPGIAKKAVPRSMLDQLPYYPGYEWQAIGDDLVLVALGTAIVTTIINGVFD